MKAKGSADRHNEGKPNWSLMPLHLLEEVVRVWEHGEKKYTPFNWAAGAKWSVPYSCIMRHLIAYFWRGERNDQESGCHHVAHVIANCMMILHYEDYFPEGDDRPAGHFGSEENG